MKKTIVKSVLSLSCVKIDKGELGYKKHCKESWSIHCPDSPYNK